MICTCKRLHGSCRLRRAPIYDVAESPDNALLGLADTLNIDNEMTMAKQLRRRYPMAVVSALDKHSTTAFLKHSDIAQHFDVIVTGLSVKHTKPYRDPIWLAAQKMKVAPQECLMIGASVDILARKSARAQTAGVLCGFGERPELECIGADSILKDITQLLEFI